MPDSFGEALMNYLNGDSTPYVIRRDDGYTDPIDVGVYFTYYSQWEHFEKEILEYAQGKVLDIGAGAGRHSLYLQEKGLEVHAVDISPGAVKVMRLRGLKNVYLMDLRKLDFPDNYFDSFLMMFNNFGLAGTTEATKNFLRVLYHISTLKGKIITTIIDPYQTDNPQHLAYHERNRKAGKPSGQVKLRIEYKGEIGDWFDLLMVSPQELKELIKNTGWGVLKIAEGEGGTYGAVLGKSRSR